VKTAEAGVAGMAPRINPAPWNRVKPRTLAP
jgi:hypothetical protein